MPEYKMLVGGELVAGDDTMEVINPATGKTFAVVPRASKAQANQASSAAQIAQTSWADVAFAVRQAKIT